LATFEIEVETEQVEVALEQAYRRVVKKVAIPGFRKGKVPRPILEATFGRESLYEEALEILFSETYQEVLKDSALEAVGEPQVEVVQIEEGKPLIYKVTTSIIPEIEIPAFKGMEVEDIVVQDPTEEDIQKVLEGYQKRMARLEEITDGQVENGSIALIDFEGYLDGQPFPGGTSKDYSLEVGSNTFIPGFEEQMLGMKIGEERELEVSFPEQYPQKELAGKPTVFKVNLRGIKQKVYPDIDDELAKDLSEWETLEEFKIEITQNLREKYRTDATRDWRDKLIEDLVALVEAEAPKPLVDARLKELITKFSQQLSIQGLSMEQYLHEMNLSQQEFVDRMRPQAETWAKTTLVLEAIAKSENITVTEEDVETRITRASEEYSMKKEDVRSSVENVIESFKEEILLEKEVDFVVENVQVIRKE